MARSCAICGKTAIGGFNPQSSGMNRVRAHRRYQPNLQPYRMMQGGTMKNVLICSRCRRTLRKTPSTGRASAPPLRKTAAG
jgi:ribosomal protein L28